MYDIGYIGYVVALLIITGALILRFDVRAYKMADMKKEKKFAKVLGWGNMIVGVLLFVVNWASQNWFW